MLLDTCGLLWLVHDQRHISAKTLDLIDKAAVVYVSAISAFEIGIKYGSGKLDLPQAPQEWFQAVIEHHDVSVIGLELETCLLATQLPPIHRDPCDRFIIATALVKRLPVVTADRRFAQYCVTEWS